MTLYKEKYRIASFRCAAWDYTSPGFYFITICTRDRRCFFGKVRRSIMVLSPLGKILAEEWQRTGVVRPYLRLDVWVVMPNHFHALIEILPHAGNRCDDWDPAIKRSRLQPHSLESIVGQFKSVCTKRIWQAGYRDFGWQPRFHDHIVQDDRALQRIRDYIRNNPAKWERDRHFSNRYRD
ncbi:MAG: transposase [Synechococcales bacterium]|nr:transposase [Synechococcales bacterium]